MTQILTINPILDKKLNDEFILLEQERGEDRAMELRMAVRNLHAIRDVELIALFEKDESERVFEILLALIGYDKTTFDVREPIKEELAKRLLDENLSNEEFYFIIYSGKFKVIDVMSVIKNDNIGARDLSRICHFSDNTNTPIFTVVNQLSRNRKVIEKHSKSDNQLLDELALKIPFSTAFEKLVKKTPSQLDCRRISNLANYWARGEISSGDFLGILSECHEEGSYNSLVSRMNECRRVV